jgi:hypothetical protein
LFATTTVGLDFREFNSCSILLEINFWRHLDGNPLSIAPAGDTGHGRSHLAILSISPPGRLGGFAITRKYRALTEETEETLSLLIRFRCRLSKQPLSRTRPSISLWSTHYLMTGPGGIVGTEEFRHEVSGIPAFGCETKGRDLRTKVDLPTEKC